MRTEMAILRGKAGFGCAYSQVQQALAVREVKKEVGLQPSVQAANESVTVYHNDEQHEVAFTDVLLWLSTPHGSIKNSFSLLSACESVATALTWKTGRSAREGRWLANLISLLSSDLRHYTVLNKPQKLAKYLKVKTLKWKLHTFDAKVRPSRY